VVKSVSAGGSVRAKVSAFAAGKRCAGVSLGFGGDGDDDTRRLLFRGMRSAVPSRYAHVLYFAQARNAMKGLAQQRPYAICLDSAYEASYTISPISCRLSEGRHVHDAHVTPLHDAHRYSPCHPGLFARLSISLRNPQILLCSIR